MNVTLRNEFHNTEATVRVPYLPAQLTKEQQARVEKKLCGAAECTCGIARGPQYTNAGERLAVTWDYVGWVGAETLTFNIAYHEGA